MANKDFKVKNGIDIQSPLPVSMGGTGQTSTTNTLNSLLPTQAGNNSKVLQTDGTNTLWYSLPAAYNRGSTGSRPGSPTAGDLYFNTDYNYFEQYTALGWFPIAAAPGTPTGVTATNQGSGRAYNNGQMSVAFTPNTSAGYPSSFIVTPSPSTSPTTFTGTSSPITVTGLSSSTQYTYTVQAASAYGTSAASTASSGVTATTVPQAPTIGTATAGDTQATITFTAGATGGSSITSYTVTSSPGSITASGASSPITVTGLTNGTAYTFTVTATNANGTSTASSASSSVTPVAPPAEVSVVVASVGTGVQAYSWSVESGVGNAIGNNSGSINGGGGGGAEGIRPGNNAIAVTNGADLTGEGLYGFAFSLSTGIGSKYSAPQRPVSRTREPYWTPDGNMVAVQTDGHPYGFAYPFTLGGGWGSRISMTATGGDRSGSLSPNGLAYVNANTTAVAGSFSSSTGWGSAFSGSQSPGGYWSSTRFSPNNNVLAVAMEGNASVNIAYAFNTSTGWGSKYANPSLTGISFGTSDGMAWAPDQKAIATGGRDGSPYLAIWAWTDASGYGTKYANPVTAPNSSGQTPNFSRNGTAVGVNAGGTPQPMWWAWNSTTGFGTKYSYTNGTGGLTFAR